MEKEIKIVDFISAIRRRLWVIGVITIFTTILSIVYGLYSLSSWSPSYQSSSKILLGSYQTDINTMGVLIKDPIVLDKVIEELKLGVTSANLSNRITFRNENDSLIVRITAVDSDPIRAAEIANATANSFVQEMANVLGIYDAKVISAAKADDAPVSSKPRPKLEIGLAVGLVLSIGIILLMDSMDHTIQSKQEAEKLLDVPVMGQISKMNRRNLSEKRLEKIKPVKGGGTLSA